jgi:hypothetical protein
MKPEFVNARRKQLQRYLDEILSIPDIARFQVPPPPTSLYSRRS